MSRKIQGVAVWYSDEPDGSEGMMGFCGPDGRWMPLVASIGSKAEKAIDDMARRISAETGRPAHKVKFTKREEAGRLDGRR
jgi:hypothetical protein